VINQRSHHVGSTDLLNQQGHEDQQQQDAQGHQGGIAPAAETCERIRFCLRIELAPDLIHHADQAARQHLRRSADGG
jgi:hypothetical protein